MVNNFKEAFNDPVPNRLREPTGNRHGRLDDGSLEAAIKSIEQILVKPLVSHPNHMKSPICSSFLKIALLIVPLALCFGSSTFAQTGGKDPLSPGPVRPGNLDYRTELRQGYLKVYSATDKFKDGDAWYFPHSSYAIYTTDGKLLKSVGNHISRTDEIPEIVALPVGSYTVVARAEKYGSVRVPVAIKEGQRTILDLDIWGSKTLARFAHS
jgi:hypothetical protein